MVLTKDTRWWIAFDLEQLTNAEFKEFREYLDTADEAQKKMRKLFFGSASDRAGDLLGAAQRRYQTIQELRLPDGHNKLVWQIERLETLVAELNKEEEADV